MHRKMLLSVLALTCSWAGWAQASDITSNLEAYWKFNEGQGQVAYDSSPMGKDAVLGIDENIGDDDPTWFVPDWGGFALSFDGGDFFKTEPLFDVGTGEVSVTWFVQQTDPTGWQYVLANKSDFTDNFFRVGFNNGDGRVRIYTEQENNQRVAVVTDEAYTGEWFWGCVTRSGDVGTLYINGEFKQTLATMAGDIGNGGRNWWIGCNGDPSSSEKFRGYLDEIRVYSRALNADDVAVLWAGLQGGYHVAFAIYPTDGQDDVPPMEVPLSWGAGEGASTHDVYVGTTFEDVNNATTADTAIYWGNQTETTFILEDMPLGTTIYWRIDERQAGVADAFKGEVWSFTTEPVGYPIENIVATSNGTSEAESAPQRTVDGSGINTADQASTNNTDMWLASAPADEALYIQYEFDRVYKLYELLVWNYNVQFELILGFGLKDVTVEYSENGTDWTALGDVEFAKATASAAYTANTAVDFGGVPARYVRLIVNSGWGMMGQFGLSEVRFLYIPVQAREPDPVDGATEVDPATRLNWRAGREAASHEVYLGMDPDALPLAAAVARATYTPDNLEFGSTYYWQVFEVNEAETVTAWASNVWSFSTLEYALIDGFEEYNDDVDTGTTIFDTWIDGWVNDNGSTVGYFDAPFAEKTIVHGGSQSMPLEYANDVTPFYAEAERDIGGADWTVGAADTLRLYVYGGADNSPETLYVAIADLAGNVAVATHPDETVLTTEAWQEWTIPYSAFNGVDLRRVATLYIGVGDRDNPSAGGGGLIFIDDVGFGSPATP